MAESFPGYAILSTVNYLVDISGSSILSATSEAPLFPSSYIANPLRSRRWRSTSATSNQQVVVQLGSSVLPTAIALVGCNIDTAQTVKVEQDVDTTFATGSLAYWNFTTYAQSQRKTLRWYPGSADSGSAAARSFFRFTFPANGTQDTDGDGVEDPYYELGALWIGTYDVIPIDFGFTIDVQDPSLVVETDSGGRFVDKLPTFHKLSGKSSANLEAVSYPLLKKLDAAASTRHVLLDVWAPTSDATVKSMGCYYGFLGGGRDSVTQVIRRIVGRDDFSLNFIEARV